MKKILSIDGGGIKGVFAVSFLAEIEKICNVKIYEYFDLIAGTSTGGIIAAALALGNPAQKVLEMYLEKGKLIFPKHRILNLFKSKYDTEPLKQALEEVVGEYKICDCKTRLLIPTYNLTTQKTKVFKTPHTEDLFFDKDIKIVDCLLATTAAPTYFSPHKMQGGTHIDGGVGANNPSLIACIEGITRCGWSSDSISMLSIGGIFEVGTITGEESMGLLNVSKILKCFMEAESQYADNICKIILKKEQYMRVNKGTIRNEVSLDNVSSKSMDKLKAWGYETAKENVNNVKSVFFQEKVEKVQFYNMERLVK